MKIRLFIISIFFAFTANSQSNNFDYKDSLAVFNNAYEPGEFLKYNIKYGLINGGIAEMSIGLEHIGWDWYYHVKAIARTTGVVQKITRVSDRYESYIDLTTGLPLQAIRDINENNYRRYNEVIFAQDKNIAISLKSGEHKIPENTLDILSAFYFARRYIFTHKLKKNDVINLTTFFDEKLIVIKIKYKKTETVKTKAGKTKCLKFVPVIDKNSPFKKESDMQVWFTDDGNFIPLKIRLSIGLGKVKCDLIEFNNLKNPFGKPFIRQ